MLHGDEGEHVRIQERGEQRERKAHSEEPRRHPCHISPPVEVGDVRIVRIDSDIVVPNWPRRVPLCQSSFSTAGILTKERH